MNTRAKITSDDRLRTLAKITLAYDEQKDHEPL